MIMCRSLLDGSATCPSDPENFEVKSLVVGAVGQGGANLYTVDITALNEALDFDRNEPISVEEVTSWDLIKGYKNPQDAHQASWDTDERELR